VRSAPVRGKRKSFVIFFKLFVTAVGAAGTLLGLAAAVQATLSVNRGAELGVYSVALLIGSVSLLMTGIVLSVSIPESVRVKFRALRYRERSRKVYGFGTTLAIGVGATLGSPLFILIPENIVQYEFVSLGALMLATVLSLLMARVYANMYLDSKRENLGAVGGPSFTRAACGTHSIRYFISRLSMWVANSALAAYSKLVLILFDVEYMPSILAGLGLSAGASQAVVYTLAALLIAWAVVSALFEAKLLRAIGRLQIITTSLLIAILIYESVSLGERGGWNISGLFHLQVGSNWLASLIINTGYLYILFFGFQEVQSLERDALDLSGVPVISWVKRGYMVDKTKFLGWAMIGAVLIATAVNVLYALAVFSVHPAASAVESSQIPALYLADSFLGASHELLMAAAFLLATFTTFVPAYLAASRHLAALSEDGFLPRSLSGYSWLFTLVWIILLALGPQNFLINVTDIMVLISLGFITLSAIWLRKHGPLSLSSVDALPLGVGLSCFVAGASVFFIDPRVAVFGAVTVIISYFIYDVFELGAFGVSVFLAVLDAVNLLFYFSVGSVTLPVAVINVLGFSFSYGIQPVEVYFLLGTGMFALLSNVLVDTFVLRRYSSG